MADMDAEVTIINTYYQGVFGLVRGHKGSASAQVNVELDVSHQRLLELDAVPPSAGAGAPK